MRPAQFHITIQVPMGRGSNRGKPAVHRVRTAQCTRATVSPVNLARAPGPRTRTPYSLASRRFGSIFPTLPLRVFP